jgi:hypothetical protein
MDGIRQVAALSCVLAATPAQQAWANADAALTKLITASDVGKDGLYTALAHGLSNEPCRKHAEDADGNTRATRRHLEYASEGLLAGRRTMVDWWADHVSDALPAPGASLVLPPPPATTGQRPLRSRSRDPLRGMRPGRTR